MMLTARTARLGSALAAALVLVAVGCQSPTGLASAPRVVVHAGKVAQFQSQTDLAIVLDMAKLPASARALLQATPDPMASYSTGPIAQFKVKVTGPNLAGPIEQSIDSVTCDANGGATFEVQGLPPGPVTVVVNALDAAGKIVSYAVQEAVVQASVTTQVTMQCQKDLGGLRIRFVCDGLPCGVPSPSPSPSYLPPNYVNELPYLSSFDVDQRGYVYLAGRNAGQNTHKVLVAGPQGEKNVNEVLDDNGSSTYSALVQNYISEYPKVVDVNGDKLTVVVQMPGFGSRSIFPWVKTFDITNPMSGVSQGQFLNIWGLGRGYNRFVVDPNGNKIVGGTATQILTRPGPVIDGSFVLVSSDVANNDPTVSIGYGPIKTYTPVVNGDEQAFGMRVFWDSELNAPGFSTSAHAYVQTGGKSDPVQMILKASPGQFLGDVQPVVGTDRLLFNKANEQSLYLAPRSTSTVVPDSGASVPFSVTNRFGYIRDVVFNGTDYFVSVYLNFSSINNEPYTFFGMDAAEANWKIYKVRLDLNSNRIVGFEERVSGSNL